MKKSRLVATGFACALSLALTAGCSSGGPSETGGTSAPDGVTLKVTYQKTASVTGIDTMMTNAKAEYEKTYPGNTIELVPIEAEQDQYFTKLALMNGSAETAPDLMYEDTFQIRSDAAAGYLQPIDEYIADWEDWDRFFDNAKQAGVGDDGKIYGVSTGTDTRGLYYNKEIFAAAGLPTDWQPKSWDELLDAARTVQAKVPDVIPFNIAAGKAGGEGTSMNGFQMVLYGTQDPLMDLSTNKWLTGSQGFKDSLAFYETVYSEGLGPDPSEALDANWGSRVWTELIPAGKVAIALDGSWLPSRWISGDTAWAEWEDVIGFAAMPTQNGEEPGFISMSGGWTIAVGANCENPKEAVDFLKIALSRESSLEFYKEQGQIAVRDDIAEDPDYLGHNSSFEFFSSLVQYTHFRPATPDYSQISANIPVATEAVATGQLSPADAQAAYDQALIAIVGEDATQAG